MFVAVEVEASAVSLFEVDAAAVGVGELDGQISIFRTLESIIFIEAEFEFGFAVVEVDGIEQLTIFIEDLSGHAIEGFEAFDFGLEFELGHGFKGVCVV